MSPRRALARIRRTTLLGVAVACAGAAAPLAGQSSACRFGAGTGNFQQITLAQGDRIVYVSRPNIICDDGVRIRADSAVTSTMQNMSHLMGNVLYRDGSRELTSDEARYFSQQGRLQANGNVFLRDTLRGSEIRNGDLVILRQTSFRDREEITVVRNVSERVRPTALLFMRPVADTGSVADSLASDSTAMEVDSIAVADSTGVPPDTAGSRPDMAAVVPPDSLAAADDSVPPVADSLATVVDSAAVVDSTAVAPDTLELAPDTADVTPDTTAVAVPPDPLVLPSDSLPAAVDSAGVPLPDPEALEAEPDTTPPVPYEVEADRLYLEGDDFFRAVGRVRMERDSLMAFSDTARYDQAEGSITLNGSAKVFGSGYDLSGRDIHMSVPDGDIETVRAIREGVLTGDRLRLDAPVIELFLVDGGMERLVAVPLRPDTATGDQPADSADLVQPVAVAEEFRLAADSVEVVAPGQVLDRINAVGTARGESTSRDSLNVEALPEEARRDWLEGDTVVATFVEAAHIEGQPRDTAAAGYVLDRLRASGEARSLYRLLPSDSSSTPGETPPAVHYVTGTTIVIVMGDGDVERMEVEGPTRGWHLEPATRPVVDTAAAGDSIPAPDTVPSDTVPPDTVPPDTVPPDTVVIRGALSPPPAGVGSREETETDVGVGSVGAAHPARRPGERERRRRSVR